ncbi:hypothetical protein B0H15DRAFT_825916 [Mycena belliarum]|uniref:Uncharacterized protein n=1 Tax=Mycena belliarum TaxID=1033014 RepID=A0AAD6U9X3_9AGAR|nr:hypothetical protein B0H15DRAFT_825916 [Mycena belliae]
MASRPTSSRSTTMPAFRRTFSFPKLAKPLALLRASSSKGLRRMSTRRSSTASNESSASTIRPSASVESIPIFTTPDYSQPIASCSVYEEISPLTVPRPKFKRATTMPAPVRKLLRLPTFKTSTVYEIQPRETSPVSVLESLASVSTTSTTQRRQRRSSSVSSVESFVSNGDTTFLLLLCAFPSAVLGIFMSIMALIRSSIFPAGAAQMPKCIPAQRPYERQILLTPEQELNPPSLPRSRDDSRRTTTLSHHIATAYRRTLRHVSRTRGSSSAEVFTGPVHVDPKTLVSEVPLTVEYSPIALPLPKGPAPAVRPARKASKPSALGRVEEESTASVLCAGW